ncbi:MAG: PD-(D/E)XK nuclease family protein, partial [Phycisphaerales bacterium]|nr:PD-(D/E)XK nuclease family protein [Phycisphaerales bacterium]
RSASKRLAACGLEEPNRARWAAAPNSGRETLHLERVVLVGVVELNPLLRRLLEAFRETGRSVVALVHAPPDAVDAVDEWGCAVPSIWRARPLALDEADLVVAARAFDVAQAAIDAIASIDGDACADDITMGLADPALGPTLVHAGATAGVDVRLAAGRLARSTEPWMAMARLAAAADGAVSTMASLAALPGAEAWLGGRIGANPAGDNDLLRALDAAAAGSRPGASRIDAAPLPAIGDAITQAIEPLRAGRRSLPAWAGPLRDLAVDLLGGSPVDAAGESAVETMAKELSAWEALPDGIAPQVDGFEALRLLAHRTGGQPCPAPPRRGQVEALGWLELHLDDAPVLVVMGLHEGAVPTPAGADPLLPGSLRTELGLPDDDTHAGRDAYLLEAMARGRDHFRVVVARRNTAGDPVLPSRLLLRCPAKEIPGRLRRLVDPRRAEQVALPRGMPAPAPTSGFVIPEPPAGPVALERMSATAFERYLRCPYRFWLEYVLGLAPIEPPTDELDALEFGNLAHDVLCAFGGDAGIRDSTDSVRIEEWLAHTLDGTVRRVFGAAPTAAITVQTARLRERLAAFARRQAQHAAEGWRIIATEQPLPPAAVLDLPRSDRSSASDGESDRRPVRIVGRVDRIDRHLSTGEWAILDYKTGDVGKSPNKVHHGGEKVSARWCSLQLPLYARFASMPVDAHGAPRLGFILLPKVSAEVGWSWANWTDAELDAAIDKAREVVLNIRAGRFERSPDVSGDAFDAICQVRALGVRGGDAPGDGDGEDGS